jgi:hypothetical protein
LAAEGEFPQADYAFDGGVLSRPLTELIEASGQHWVSEIESSRWILWPGQWQRVEGVAQRLRFEHPERFRPKMVNRSPWSGTSHLGLHQDGAVEQGWLETTRDRACNR